MIRPTRPYRLLGSTGALLALVFWSVRPAGAQVLEPLSRHVAEFGTQLHRYSDDIDPWNGIYLRTQIPSGARNAWLGEVLAEDRFGEQAFSYKLEYALDQPSWFARAGGRTSTSGFFNPKWRADLRLGVKTLEDRTLLLSVAGFRQEMRDGHEDTGVTAEFQYYGGPSWIVQGAVRWTHSNPGAVWSRYHDAALTLGRYGVRNVTLHVAAGRETYQIIGPLTVLADFDSWMTQVTWREWLSRKVGFHLSGIWYQNEFYRRGGIEAGLFIHFRGQ